MSDGSYPALVCPTVINLNWWMSMQLTDRGQELLAEHNAKIRREIKSNTYAAERIDPNGMYEFQLYEAVSIFAGAGMPDTIMITEDSHLSSEPRNWTWKTIDLRTPSQALLTLKGEHILDTYRMEHGEPPGTADVARWQNGAWHIQLSEIPLVSLFDIFGGSHMPNFATLHGVPFHTNVTLLG